MSAEAFEKLKANDKQALKAQLLKANRKFAFWFSLVRFVVAAAAAAAAAMAHAEPSR